MKRETITVAQVARMQLPFTFWRDVAFNEVTRWGSAIQPGELADSRKTLDQYLREIRQEILWQTKIQFDFRRKLTERRYHFLLQAALGRVSRKN